VQAPYPGSGLALVMRSVEVRGCSVHVESDGRRGMLFRFTRPEGEKGANHA